MHLRHSMTDGIEVITSRFRAERLAIELSASAICKIIREGTDLRR